MNQQRRGGTKQRQHWSGTTLRAWNKSDGLLADAGVVRFVGRIMLPLRVWCWPQIVIASERVLDESTLWFCFCRGVEEQALALTTTCFTHLVHVKWDFGQVFGRQNVIQHDVNWCQHFFLQQCCEVRCAMKACKGPWEIIRPKVPETMKFLLQIWYDFSSWIHFMIDQDPKSLGFYASKFLKGRFMQEVKMWRDLLRIWEEWRFSAKTCLAHSVKLCHI